MTDTPPADLRYTKDHEWARFEDDLVTVGITAYAVEQLGDITLVTLPEPGTTVDIGDSFGDLDSVKAVSELYAPISGEIVECNEELEDAPERVNEEPYGAGWMVKIKPSEPSQIEEMMDAKAYAELLDGLE
jgi:glycine cleavage system H protein